MSVVLVASSEMVGDFYIHAVSNAKGYDNKTCSFTQRLAKKLEFSASWKVGLSSIIYPYSWPAMGTQSHQFISIKWQTGITTTVRLKSASYKTSEELATCLEDALLKGTAALCREKTDEAESAIPHERRKRNQSDEAPDDKELSEAVKALTGKTPAEHANEIRELRNRITTLKTEKQNLETHAKNSIDALNKQITDLQNLSSQSSQQNNEEILKLQGQVTELITQATTDKQAHDNELEKLTNELTAMQRRLDEAHAITQRAQLHSERIAALYEGRIQLLEQRLRFLESGGKPEHDSHEDNAVVVLNDQCDLVSGAPYDKLAEYVRIMYDTASERFVIELDPGIVAQVQLSDQLKFMLGFEEDIFTKPMTIAHYMPDLLGDIHSLYIYAPQLVEPTLIGDTMSPLLRIVKVKGSPGAMVEDTFLKPQYLKVLEKQVSEISIQIRTATGRLVPFNWGECILVLHFKKLSPF